MQTHTDPRLARLIRELITAVKGFVDAVSENTKANHETAAQEKECYSRIASGINSAVEEQRDYHTESKRPDRLKRLALLVNFLTLLAVTYYACVTKRQLGTMNATFGEARKQTTAATIAADAAKSAADTAYETLKDTRKTFVLEQRPYMITDIPRFLRNPAADSQPIEVNVAFKNIGKSPAIKRRTQVELLRFRAAKKTKDPMQKQRAVEKYVNFIEGSFSGLNKRADNPGGKYAPLAREDVAPGAQPFSTAVNKTPLTAEELGELQTGGLTLFLTGIVRYTDGSGASYQTDFWYFYFGNNPETWHICDAHNTIK